ncbi:spermidine N(1)-acetyltransferase [Clostridium tepidiprofundi DSM 19306]|uniref:Spermidine N(1)-acetyltransferase n=1 Tax=Clostridium tepidiprofundi DSM 19306 TaxID=1121338 RepID=A0A151B6R2_9CLOT|nr:GNAT family protein [Clostridium tepidiprofundi]KYH35470.1 spermidine N(1)-acetyltransferase [Clostridium tepidiprofundi DSM 19306]
MLIGKKVILRDYRKEDAKLAHQYINDFELRKFLTPGIPYPLTLEEEQNWVDSQSKSDKNTFSFAIESIKDSKYIGGCGINNIDWKNSIATVGIFIGNKNYLGKGFGTDAMNLLLEFIFCEMNIHKVKLHVYSFNKRAIRSYEKCGFVKEGTLRQELFREGKYHDEYIMGILREEFFKQRTYIKE